MDISNFYNFCLNSSHFKMEIFYFFFFSGSYGLCICMNDWEEGNYRLFGKKKKINKKGGGGGGG